MVAEAPHDDVEPEGLSGTKPRAAPAHVTLSHCPLLAPWDIPVWHGRPCPGRGKAGGHARYTPCPRATTRDPHCPRGSLCPPVPGTCLVHREPIKHTANTLLSRPRLRWVDPSTPMPSQSPRNGCVGKTKGPGFIAELDDPWRGAALGSLWLGSPCCVPSQPLAQPQPTRSGTHREDQRKPWRSAGTAQHHLKHCCVFNTVCSQMQSTAAKRAAGSLSTPPPLLQFLL